MNRLLRFEGFVAAMVVFVFLLFVAGFINDRQTKEYKQECIKQGKVYFMKKDGNIPGNYEEGCR